MTHLCPLFCTFNARKGARLRKSCTFAPVIIKYDSIMSERDKQIEKERKGVVELLLKKITVNHSPHASAL